MPRGQSHAGDSHFPARSEDGTHGGAKSDCPHSRNGGAESDPQFTRIIVGADPPAGDGTCGIIACAKDEEGRAHVLADHSVTARSPKAGPAPWRRRRGSGDTCIKVSPSKVVAEKNQGGAMVRAVLHTAEPDLNVKLVTATCGKSERAEPDAMLFEAGKVARGVPQAGGGAARHGRGRGL